MATIRWKAAIEAVESIAVILAAAAVVFVLLSDRAPRAQATSQAIAPLPEDIKNQHASASIKSPTTLGREDANLVLIEFGDYQCPFCGKFARETFPRLRKEFVDTAKLRFSFKHFPLDEIHPLARTAARNAACAAEQARFWDVHDRLFEGRLSAEFLAGLPSDLKLDKKTFETCLTRVDSTIAADAEEGRRLGVSSTPIFYLGTIAKDGSVELVTKLAGALPYESFATAINKTLERR